MRTTERSPIGRPREATNVFSGSGVIPLKLYRLFTGVAGVQALSVALLLVLHVLMARIFGSEVYGTYVYIMAWLNVAAVLGKFGADRGVVWLMSRALAQGDLSNIRQIFIKAAKIVFGFTIVAAVVAAVTFSWVEGTENDPTILAAAIGILVLIGVTFSFLQKGALLGLGAPILSKVPTELLRPLLMIGGVLAIVQYCLARDTADLMWLTLFTYIVVLCAGHLIWLSLVARARRVNTKSDGQVRTIMPSIRNFAPFVGISASAILMRYTDVILIGAIAGPEQVAVYSVAARVVSLVLFVQRSASPVIQPIVSRAWALNDTSLMRETVLKTTLATTVGTALICFALLVSGRQVLSIFGPEFILGEGVMTILLVGQFVNVLSGPNSVLLSMTNYQKITSRVLWVAAMANILGNLMLIPQLGAIGAAIATSVINCLWNVSLIFFSRKKLNIDPSIFGLLGYLRGNK